MSSAHVLGTNDLANTSELYTLLTCVRDVPVAEDVVAHLPLGQLRGEPQVAQRLGLRVTRVVL